MSLYIGQISARTHRDDLERVFRRYGQCDVRLKDGYGFVVYDFPLNAEKALRGLQGKSIFGQQLTITWSKKQPRAFQRYTRGARSYESHGRDFGRRKGPNDWGNYSSGNRQTDGDGDRLNSEDMLAEGRDYHQEETIDCVGEEHDNFREDLRRDGDDYLGEEQDNYRENFARDGGDYIRERDNFREDLARDGGGTVSKIDNGRWGERVDDHSNENGLYSDLNTDRYEPYQGYDRRDKDENRWKTRSGGSTLGSSQENVGRELDGYSCFSCGALGHKMRDCPRKHSSRRKITRFDRGPDDDISKGRGDGELERFESKSGNNVQPSKGAKLREMNDKRGDGELERFESKSGHIVQPCKGAELRKMNDKWTSNSEKHQVSIKNRNSDEVVRVQGKDSERKKRNKRETGSPKRQSAKKPKRSASTTFDSEYPASRARSVSKSLKSFGRSISQSRSRSVSVGSLSSDSKASSKLGYLKSLSSKSRSRSSSHTSLSLSVSIGRPASSPGKAHINHKESLNDGVIPKSPCIEVRKSIKGDTHCENAQTEIGMTVLKNGNAVSASEVENDTEKNQDTTKSRSLFKMTSLGNSQSDVGAGHSTPDDLKVTSDQTNSDALATNRILKPTDASDSGTPTVSSGRSTNISLNEMCMVLKHYGLEVPEESERHHSLESYFGSARLWPWQSIYYRRMRKGPVSVENYAKRVAQNQEFGIVDKYIRSSSGWGEMFQENP
ncbi:hypothetical protein CsatB_019366 [Cannabis sativa]|uniref:uncharacterized protein LOC115700497 n=1 Tax=Cannabis sativa TaxID=3483 RepID=UPI0029CA17ED|nr:uncharacterized protein LOC115700497 [Cannabis sativa]XP_060958472.1 uncharacterized protein LOC115700497 [Cannabis sativa]